jgi:molybdopterin converting factor small subunit
MNADHIQVSIKLFSVYQEIIGESEITQNLPVGTAAGDVLQQLASSMEIGDTLRS